MKPMYPVRNCWGGMVAFDAQFSQPVDNTTSTTTSVVEVAGPQLQAHFRALQDVDLF
jgi:predicted aminopeptidase